MRRSRVVVALLAAGGFAVAGCSAPGPAEVTFYADGHSLRAVPTISCDYRARTDKPCVTVATPQALRIRPGKPVQISVPGEVAKTPWQIVFEYITPQGETRQSDPVPFPFDRYAYTVTPPTPGDRIFSVEVQQFAAVVRTTSGELSPAPSAFWGLRLDA